MAIAALHLAFAGPASADSGWQSAGGAIFAPGPAPQDAGQDVQTLPTRLPGRRQPYDAAVTAAAARHGLDPKLLHALIVVESAYRTDAVSPAGAAGLTQLTPATATSLGVTDRFDPAQNVSAGADFLARQLRRFGDLRLALAAFNAGPERVARVGRIPRIAETEAYVSDVVECFLALSAGRAIRRSPDCRAAAP